MIDEGMALYDLLSWGRRFFLKGDIPTYIINGVLHSIYILAAFV
jgi:hypothetical protein